MIPTLQDGVLPVGLHDCTIDEVVKAFGQFRRSDRRPQLTEKLLRFVEDARRSGIVSAVILDGSYVTAKDEPNDIDLLLVLQSDFDLKEEMRPLEYNVQSKRMVRKLYGFDVLTAVEGSETYLRLLAFFSRVRPDDPEQQTKQTHKGLLRITL